MNHVDQWLQQRTQFDGASWVAYVQRKIAEHTKPTDDPNHGTTDTKQVMLDLITEIEKTFPITGDPYDENMRMCSVLSVITCLWYARVHMAKCHDPNRPAGIRRRGYRAIMDYMHALLDCLVDESQDSTYFPAQRWDRPFSHDSESGSFI